MTKAGSPLKTINSYITSKLGQKTINQFLDEWLKDKTFQNTRRVKEIFKALEELETLLTIPVE
jgi:hypothetical protein